MRVLDARTAAALHQDVAGRLFQDPSHCDQIWAAFGWSSSGQPQFPVYHESLGDDISEEEFNGIFSALQADMQQNGPAITSPTCSLCAIMCCPCSCGVSCCYFHHVIKSYHERLVSVVRQASTGLQCSVRFELVEMDQISATHFEGRDWTDSNGLPLVIGTSGNGAVVGGPPQGYNVVFTLTNEIDRWLPSPLAGLLLAPGAIGMGNAAPVHVATAVPAAMGATATATAIPIDGLQFCRHCGARSMSPNDVLCGICGGNQAQPQYVNNLAQPPLPGEVRES